MDLIENYGVDAVRFYLMREMVLGLDANFTPDSFIKCFNSDLANDFGNLLNRVSGLIQKNHGGQIPQPGTLTTVEEDIKTQANALPARVKDLINEFKVQEAVTSVLDFVRVLNKYMEAQAPWKLAHDGYEGSKPRFIYRGRRFTYSDDHVSSGHAREDGQCFAYFRRREKSSLCGAN